MQERAKVLHIDDNADLLNVYETFLSTEFDITTACTPKEIRKALKTQKFDALLLDVHMPTIDGSDVLKLLRSNSGHDNVVVLALSGDNETNTKVNYLKLGISDYISKYTSQEELILRIKNGLKKVILEKTINIGNLALDTSRFTVQVDRTPISLTLTEYKLLIYLLTSSNEFICRDSAVEYVWNDTTTSKSALNTHLFNLKNKLDGWNYDIKSVRQKGITIEEKQEFSL